MKRAEKYVFISYSSKNQKSAENVRMLLKNSNIHSWMAPYDIPVGSKYAYEINDAIEKCACFVLLLTEESQISEFVEKEVDRAITYKKPIIPLQLGNIILNSGFKYYLGNSQIMVLTEINEDSEEWIKAREAIKSFVSNFNNDVLMLKRYECEKYPYEVKAGKFENGIGWKLDANGDLHIYGSGDLKCATIYGQTFDKVIVDSYLKEIQKKVVRVFIGEGIESIGAFSFYEFSELTEVFISDTVRVIGIGVFKNCYKLRHIEMPLSLEIIDNMAFQNCSSLENFELPDKVSIGSEAFQNCYSLTRLNKRGRSIKIYQRVFENCQNLHYVSLHNVDFIGAYAFAGCPVEHVELSFQSAWMAHTVNGQQTLQQNAFALSGVEKIHLRFPNMVMSTALSYDIGEHCFEGCNNLKDVFFEEAIPYISGKAFPNDQELHIHVNKNVYNNKLINSFFESKWKIECLDK